MTKPEPNYDEDAARQLSEDLDREVAASPPIDWEAAGHVILDARALRDAGRLDAPNLQRLEERLRAISSLGGLDLERVVGELRALSTG